MSFQILEDRTLLAGLVSDSAPYISTPADPWIPNFVKDSDFRSECTGNCFWDSAASWSTGRVPNANDRVIIDPGDEIVIRNQNAAAGVVVIDVGGKLRFDPQVNTELDVVTLLVLGDLEIGTEATPVADNVTARVTFADTPIDLNEDPGQYGNGLLALRNANIRIHGRTLPETFIRLNREPRAGDRTLSLSEVPTGWKAGDEILLPDTRHLRWNELPRDGRYVPEWEELRISRISGTTITLNSPLKFDHLGARDADGQLDFLPHVVNRTRNVVLQSANPDGTRGHTLFQGRSDIDVRYAAFQNLGRTKNIPVDSTTWDSQGNATYIGTNQIARYAIHTHHLVGPTTPQANGFQYTLIGNSIDNGSDTHDNKWAVAIHGSHYGLIQRNTAYNIAGAAFVTEDGSESFNVFEKNFVLRSYSVGSGYRYSVDSGGFHSGREATGFWFRGPNNYVRGNVATNVMTFDQVESAYGFKYLFILLGTTKIPAAQGEMPAMNGISVDMNTQPILEFSDNEVYGATEGGLTYWWIGMRNVTPLNVTETSLIKDFDIWHVHNRGIYAYHSNKVTIDGLVIRGHDPRLSAFGAIGYEAFDYPQRESVFKNVDIQNMNKGIRLSTHPFDTLIENSVLRNWSVNLSVSTPQSCCGFIGHVPARAEIRNVRFGPPADSSATAPTIRMRYNQGGNLVELNEVFVYDYNGVAGDDFQLFYYEQDPEFIVPQSNPTLIASPEAGLTNAETWKRYGIAIAGGLAPTKSEREGIQGYVGPITIPSNRPPSAVADAFTLTVNRTDLIHGQLLANDFDVDEDALTVVKLNGEASNIGSVVLGNFGSLRVQADGLFEYTLDRSVPDVQSIDLGETLVDSFVATISDGENLDSATFEVLINRTGQVVPFQASDDASSILTSIPTTTGNVLTNDSSLRGTLSVTAVNDTPSDVGQMTNGNYGTLRLNANGTYLYTLDTNHAEVMSLGPNQSLQDQFNYTMTDGSKSDTATLFVRISGSFNNNQAPVAVPDTLQMTENGTNNPLRGNVLANDLDPDGDRLVVTRLNGLWNNVGVTNRYNYGDFVLFHDGTFEYTLDENLDVINNLDDGDFLIEAFNYVVSDGNANTVTPILIYIHGVNDSLLPKAVDDDANLFEDDTPTVTGNLLVNDSVPSGEAPTVISVAGEASNVNSDLVGQFGVWHIRADGGFVYTVDNTNPAVDNLDNGQLISESIEYEMADSRGSSRAALTVTINGVRDNQSPEATPDVARIDKNAVAPVFGNLLANDDDPDGDALVVTDVSGRVVTTRTTILGNFGSLQVDRDGTFSYRVNSSNPTVRALGEGESLSDTFTYIISDGLIGVANLLTVNIDGTSKQLVPGDSNGDGVFDSSDLVIVFQSGEYEDGIQGNSTFAEGDWNQDGDFDSADIIFAFQHGSYSAGVAAINDSLDSESLDSDHVDRFFSSL